MERNERKDETELHDRNQLTVTDANLLQLHIAEYTALTTRGSYWIVIQAGMLTLVPIFLALAGQVNAVADRAVVSWGVLAGLTFTAMVWTVFLGEHYKAVYYMECYLRRLIERELGYQAIFWGYEPFLSGRGHRPNPISIGEFLFPAIGIFALTGVAYFRNPYWNHIDTLGVIGCGVLTLCLWLLSIEGFRTRRKWYECSKRVAKDLET